MKPLSDTLLVSGTGNVGRGEAGKEGLQQYPKEAFQDEDTSKTSQVYLRMRLWRRACGDDLDVLSDSSGELVE